MSLSLAFNLVIYYVSIFWIGMIVFPNWNITKKIMGSYLTFIPLGGLYFYYLITINDVDSLTSAFNPELSVYANLFAKERGALIVSIHFLAMDLFVGRWIYWRGQDKQIWTTHSLILCLFFGPLGLVSHIITEIFLGKNILEGQVVNDELAESTEN